MHFFYFPWDIFFMHGLFRSMLLSFSSVWWYSYYLVSNFQLTSKRSENTWYMIKTLKHVAVHFKAQEVVYLDICFMGTWKECTFCYCWVEYFINVDSVLLIDGVFKFFYILDDFLSCCCFSCQERMLKFPTIIMDFPCLLPPFYHCGSHSWQLWFFVHTHLVHHYVFLVGWPSYLCSFLPGNILYLIVLQSHLVFFD